MKRFKKIPILILPVLALVFLFPKDAVAQGHFEFGFHYSRWNINILRSIVEEGLSEALETDLKDAFLTDIQEEHPSLFERYYSQNVNFDSSGNNFGFEIRWYPAGENGAFSMGLSLEKTTMEVTLSDVSANLELEDELTQKTANFKGGASGSFLMKPLSFHLSLRWDIMPSSVVHPYITFGLGASTGTALESSELNYSYSGELNIEGEETEYFDGGDTKTLQELMDEMEEEGEEFFLPGFIPFIQLNLGVKAKIAQNLYLLVDAGIFNGFLIRGGIALRI